MLVIETKEETQRRRQEMLRQIDHCLALVRQEIEDATKVHGKFHSAHEGYAVILEELDELWDEVKAKHYNSEKGFKEAKQVAAMAIRYMVDIK